MIDILITTMIIGFGMIIFIIGGEWIATKAPNSKFTKWWRKNWIGIEE